MDPLTAKKLLPKHEALTGWHANAYLYELSEPVDWRGYDEDANPTKGETNYVIVSVADVFTSGLETYIFAADKDANVLSWLEMEGSFRGGDDPAKALKGLGYELL